MTVSHFLDDKDEIECEMELNLHSRLKEEQDIPVSTRVKKKETAAPIKKDKK